MKTLHPAATQKGEIQCPRPRRWRLSHTFVRQSCGQTHRTSLYKVNGGRGLAESPGWAAILGSPDVGEKRPRGVPPPWQAARCCSPLSFLSKPRTAGLGNASLRWQLVKWRCSHLSGSLEVSWGLIKWCLKTLRAPGRCTWGEKPGQPLLTCLGDNLDGETDSSGDSAHSALQVLFFPPPAPPFFFKSYVWQTVKSFSRNIFNLQKKKNHIILNSSSLKIIFCKPFLSEKMAA